MSMQKVSVMVPPLRAGSPGRGLGRPVGGVALRHRRARVRSSLQDWLEAVRASLAVDRAARREARGRAELIALASRYEASQPEFAKDLFAAANTDRGR